MSAPETTFRAPTPGKLAPVFPKYQILSLIATGGMGAVYHAVQTSLERQVAIKILPVEFGKDPEFCESFGAEAKAMAKLNHPNLISVYDFGEVNGMLFIVMEYVPGQSLHNACNGAAVDPAEVIRLMTGICQGLANAHQHGILHRDIKPANILLDAFQQPKIGDFGLARPLDAKVKEGESIFGTPGYTAPEVIHSPHTMDHRADIFSLGVLLHELLTGHLPANDPRPPSAISQCDPRFDAVVRMATHPNPIQRYCNAQEIADELRKIGSTAGPRAVRTGPAAANRRPATRLYPTQPTKKGGSGLLVVLTLIAGALAVFFFMDRPSHMPDPSPAPAQVVEHKPEPVKPGAATTEPEPEPPGPGPLVEEPEPVKPDPAPVVAKPAPVLPETGTKPGKTETVTAPQPKFDVDGFLAHARSVMAKRCDPDFDKYDESLAKNLEDFNTGARRLIKSELGEIHHQAAENELDEFVAKRRADGNRMGIGLENKLKFKKWIVELHKEHQTREELIDDELMRSLAEQEKTYLQGLSLRIKALELDDPAAADLIKNESDKVEADPDYFADLMRDAIAGN